MAIVWIMSRDVEKVAAQKASPSSVNVLTFDDDLAFDAKSELWRALQEGALTATGRKNGSRQQIPAMLWQDMLPILDSAGGESFSDRLMHGTHWHEVTVKRDDVICFWRPMTSNAGKPALSKEKADWKRFAQLPDAPWLPLQAVSFFIETGWYCDRNTISIIQLSRARVSGSKGSKRDGSLMSHLPDGISDSDDTSVRAFYIDFTNAAFCERIQLQGVKVGNTASQIERIPPAYFATCREFDKWDNEIGPINEFADWREVTIERESLLDWLRVAYPAIAVLHDRAAEVSPSARYIKPCGYEDIEIGPPVLPAVGTVPVSIAALWIATDSGSKPVRQLDKELWLRSYRLLLDAIAGRQVELIGRTVGGTNGLSEVIAGHIVAGLFLTSPFDASSWEAATTANAQLLPVLDDPNWKDWWCKNADRTKADHENTDVIRDGHYRVLYHSLQVQSEDVLRLWPIGSEPTTIIDAKVSVALCDPTQGALRAEKPAASTGCVSVTPAIRNAYIARVSKCKETGHQPSRGDDEAFMKLNHRISRDSTRALRKEHAPDWAAKGRPSKSAAV
jgi:hypothetical protein